MRLWLLLSVALLIANCHSSAVLPNPAVIAAGAALVPAQDGCHWGFLDSTGAWAIAPVFKAARAFSDGAAAVRAGGRYGFVRPDGSWLLPPAYDYAEDFRGAHAVVYPDGPTPTVIDRAGHAAFRYAGPYQAITLSTNGEVAMFLDVDSTTRKKRFAMVAVQPRRWGRDYSVVLDDPGIDQIIELDPEAFRVNFAFRPEHEESAARSTAEVQRLIVDALGRPRDNFPPNVDLSPSEDGGPWIARSNNCDPSLGHDCYAIFTDFDTELDWQPLDDWAASHNEGFRESLSLWQRERGRRPGTPHLWSSASSILYRYLTAAGEWIDIDSTVRSVERLEGNFAWGKIGIETVISPVQNRIDEAFALIGPDGTRVGPYVFQQVATDYPLGASTAPSRERRTVGFARLDGEWGRVDSAGEWVRWSYPPTLPPGYKPDHSFGDWVCLTPVVQKLSNEEPLPRYLVHVPTGVSYPLGDWPERLREYHLLRAKVEGNTVLFRSDGTVFHRDDNSPDVRACRRLNIDYMRTFDYGVFEGDADSLRRQSERSGWYAERLRELAPYFVPSDAREANSGGVELLLRDELGADTAYTIDLINGTDEAYRFGANGNSLAAELQVRYPEGNWQSIETWPSEEGCGSGVAESQNLPAGHAWRLVAPRFRGSDTVEMRLRVRGVEPAAIEAARMAVVRARWDSVEQLAQSSRSDHTEAVRSPTPPPPPPPPPPFDWWSSGKRGELVSPVWMGTINPAQIWRRL